MIIAVGSTNPTKLEAVRMAVEEVHTKLGLIGELTFHAHEVPSGVSAQPLSDGETRLGARNRARLALEAQPDAELAFGLEGGVMDIDDEMFSTVWICVLDREGREFAANGARFALPLVLAKAIRAGGEMGPAMDEITGRQGIKHQEGMIGVVTGGVITRASEYGHIARMAYALYHGPKLE
jgi:inosine/xanthosine triphosphatase